MIKDQQVTNLKMSTDNRLLDDDSTLMILKYFTFNEKYRLRLVCKQFKNLIDSIPIRKLIIYEKHPQLSGKFQMIDEHFSYLDTVYVYDLNEFFNTKPIIENLKKSIKKLVIYGLDSSLISLKEPFNELTYLELKDICFSNATILESQKLKQLLIYRSSFETPENFDEQLSIGKSISSTIFNHLSGLNSLKGKLKHFVCHFSNLDDETEFFKLCVKAKIFSELEILEIYLEDLNTLTYLSKALPRLKQIYLFSGKTFFNFRDAICDTRLADLVEKLRPDLTVYLFGIPLLKDKIEIIDEFFHRIAGDTKLNNPIIISRNVFQMCGQGKRLS